MNAASVIGLLGDELVQRVERDFPPADGGGDAVAWPLDPKADGDVIRLTGSGCYLRIVDYDGLAALAARTHRRFTTLVAPGAFRVPGSPIVRVHGGPLDDACLGELRGLFSWGGDRTPDQDILFLVDQLGEILRHGVRIVGSKSKYADLIRKHLFDNADFMPYRSRILLERRRAWTGK
jgi:uncharacterized membrane protein